MYIHIDAHASARRSCTIGHRSKVAKQGKINLIKAASIEGKINAPQKWGSRDNKT